MLTNLGRALGRQISLKQLFAVAALGWGSTAIQKLAADSVEQLRHTEEHLDIAQAQLADVQEKIAATERRWQWYARQFDAMRENLDSAAESAFNAYREDSAGVSHQNGRPIPYWAELPQEARDHWRAAARVILFDEDSAADAEAEQPPPPKAMD